MNAAVLRLAWIAIVAAAVAFSTHTFFGSTIAASANEQQRQEVIVRDAFADGAHYLSGILALPSDCYELSVTPQLVNEHAIELQFESWKQPYRDCAPEPDSRAYEVIVFAPKEISFTSTLDGQELSVHFIPVTP